MSALYIHIPFCKRKCNYCDFVSYAGREDLLDGYVEALLREINSPPLSPSLKKRGGTIYFGGGTPTLLSPQHFERILFESRTSSLVPREITIEANPGTISKSYLKELRQLGINRISLGAQTFNDRHLKTLGRIHSSKQIYQAVDDARSAGFDNINLDLIFSLPGQTLDELKEDIEQALSLKPEHLSTYNLQLEEGTPFWEMFCKPATERRGFQNRKQEETAKFIRRFPTEDEEAEMYEFIIDTLTSRGYKHYEISNFARPGKECQHNVNYWENGNYIGIGAGAHSHVDGKRWSNPNCLEAYMQGDAPRITLNETHLAPAQRETLFMGLRLLEGLPTDSFAGFEADVADLKIQGLLEEQNSHIKLTKKGLFLANLVFERFV